MRLLLTQVFLTRIPDLIWDYSTLAATELSRLVAVRYLAGILELPSFWRRRIHNDLHTLTDVLCLVSIRLIEDLAADSEKRNVIVIDDLVMLDLEGINALIFVSLDRCPLRELPVENIRTASSLATAGKLIKRLQTQVFSAFTLQPITHRNDSDRAIALFPEASERAGKFLPRPETDAAIDATDIESMAPHHEPPPAQSTYDFNNLTDDILNMCVNGWSFSQCETADNLLAWELLGLGKAWWDICKGVSLRWPEESLKLYSLPRPLIPNSKNSNLLPTP